MKPILPALVALTCAFAAPVGAQTEIDRFDIAILAEQEADQSSLATLATTFAMLAPQTSGMRRNSRVEYHSGTGMVEDGAASEKLRNALPPALVQSVEQLETMRAGCDISRHSFADADILLIVHDATEAQPQDAHRCFVAGLWVYHTGGAQGVDVSNWRPPYARILESVATGQPAFAGFATGDK